jgi:sugar transferase (PEP-CTERM/EpsH1 system associated)
VRDAQHQDEALAIAAATPVSAAPTLVHVIHHLGTGGLENGLVNLLNRMPGECYRHVIVCMTTCGDFRDRIRNDSAQVYEMLRGEVPLALVYWRLFRLFRRLQPAIVHTRNLSGLDALLPAVLAGVPVRIHGEHGRDMDDLDGSNARHLRLKRLFRPLVTRYTAVSKDLARYLESGIDVPAWRVHQIYNGVDTSLFRPSTYDSPSDSTMAERSFTIGTVGRLQPVKNQRLLVRAFGAAVSRAPRSMATARLIMVGEGPMRPALESAIAESSLQSRVQLVGARNDVPDVLREMDVFVLPSLAEGISNTILEAMATGLPVIATRVGGNSELIEDERTGALVETGDWSALADRLIAYASDPTLRARHGRAARVRAEHEFSLDAMVRSYTALYDSLLGRSHRSIAGRTLRASP